MGLCCDSLDEILVLFVSDDRHNGFSCVSHLRARWDFNDRDFKCLVWFLFWCLDKCDADVILSISVVEYEGTGVFLVITSLEGIISSFENIEKNIHAVQLWELLAIRLILGHQLRLFDTLEAKIKE